MSILSLFRSIFSNIRVEVLYLGIIIRKIWRIIRLFSWLYGKFAASWDDILHIRCILTRSAEPKGVDTAWRCYLNGIRERPAVIFICMMSPSTRLLATLNYWPRATFGFWPTLANIQGIALPGHPIFYWTDKGCFISRSICRILCGSRYS